MGALGIISGGGLLPKVLAEDCADKGRAYFVVGFDGLAPDWMEAHPGGVFRFEALGALFDGLRQAAVTEVVFAGGMARPALDPAKADPTFLRIAPQLMAALQQGDDATLRFVCGLFEGEGFAVLGADQVVPGLLAEEGVLGAVSPGDADRADARRAAEIVAALGTADVGQGAVVADGICLGVEAIGGTDFLLESVARLPETLRRGGGVLLKTPKPGQDRRFDLPAIGPGTVAAAKAAGLRGIVVEAGGVLLIDRAALVAAADDAGLFLWARA